MTKERAIAYAQRQADDTGKAMAVLNLNMFSPLYVCRTWDDRFSNDRQLVAKVEPQS